MIEEGFFAMLLYESKEDGTATNIKTLVAYMKDAIKNNAYNYVETAIKKLYNYQTEYEQNNRITYDRNGVGFNAIDAATLSRYAKQLLSGKHLSAEQLAKAKILVPKYAEQLINTYIMSGKITKVRKGLYKWTPRAENDKLKKIVQKRQNEEPSTIQTDLFDQY